MDKRQATLILLLLTLLATTGTAQEAASDSAGMLRPGIVSYPDGEEGILLPDTLPPILGNPLRLRQLANNLLENAIKYTPEGGEIGVSLEEDSGFLVLRVADTGIGVPKEDQPYIFDKFYRTDEAIDHYSGTGLGLSIVKGIVDQHGGRIWVDSREGKGSAFTVMLPGYEPEL